MEPLVRVAQPEDVDRLALLRWNMHAEDSAPAEDYESFLGRFRMFAKPALDSTAWRVSVAELDEIIVGNLWLQLVTRVPRPINAASSALGYLTNVYVEPPYRDLGLGSRMLREIVDWCREQAIGVVVVWPSERSTDYYRRQGFRESDALQLSLKED